MTQALFFLPQHYYPYHVRVKPYSVLVTKHGNIVVSRDITLSFTSKYPHLYQGVIPSQSCLCPQRWVIVLGICHPNYVSKQHLTSDLHVAIVSLSSHKDMTLVPVEDGNV